MKPERFKEIADRLVSGQSNSQITFDLQCGNDTVTKVRRQLDLKPSTHPSALKCDVLSKILSLLQSGRSLNSISNDLLVHRDTIRRYRAQFILQGKLKAKVTA